MKKKFMAIALLVSSFALADFLGEIQKIDKDIQNKNYSSAIAKGEALLKTKLSDSDKEILNTILDEVRAKVPMEEIKAKTEITVEDGEDNNIGENFVTPIVEKASRGKFDEYYKYEKEILATNNSIAINDYAKWYIEHGLYEKAMKLALKDPNKSVENIYLAATAARMIGKYDTSINLYKKVLRVNPNHYKSFLGLAMNYKMKRHFKSAISYLRKYQQYNNSPEIERQIQRLQALE